MKVKKFHQFIILEKGPVNTAVIDFLKGNIYQVANEIIEKFEVGKHDEIKEFIKSVEEEELIIEIDETDWIPVVSLEEDRNDSFRLEIKEGVNLQLLKDKFQDCNISKVFYYGYEIPSGLPAFAEFERREFNFDQCLKLSIVDGEFTKINENIYRFNMRYNSCWGKKISVTEDGKIRPCMHSPIIIGDLRTDNIESILKKAKEYWEITKDEVLKCTDCELRYVCFDCRVIAAKEGGSLFAANPYCKYDPYKGTWSVTEGDGACE